MEESNPFIGYAVLLLALTSIFLSLLYSQGGSPILGVINRWVRWVLFSLGLAYLIQYMEWSGRPFWALSLMAFLGWFLVETGYNWLLIKAISRSDIPLFPRFYVNEEGDEWPAQARYLKIREWLRKNKFKKRQSLKADLIDGVELRSSVYDSRDGKIRLQILFIPRKHPHVSACAIFSSSTGDGKRLITDNVFMPFGGFYPENWNLQRRPLYRSIQGLYKKHLKRILKEKDIVSIWNEDEEPLQDLNEQQKILEKVNTDLGFLFPRYLHEEYGKFTQKGKYRVWLEVWLLNYFGRTVSAKT